MANQPFNIFSAFLILNLQLSAPGFSLGFKSFLINPYPRHAGLSWYVSSRVVLLQSNMWVTATSDIIFIPGWWVQYVNKKWHNDKSPFRGFKAVENSGVEPLTFPKAFGTLNLLNNDPMWRIPGSNRLPLACHASALPIELIPLMFLIQWPSRMLSGRSANWAKSL